MKFDIYQSNARILPFGGMAAAGLILERGKIRTLANAMPIALAHPQNTYTEGDVFLAAIGQMCAGNTTFESVREYYGDPQFYQEALGIQAFISPERLRQRLDENAAGTAAGYSNHAEIRDMNLSLLLNNHVHFTPLANGMVPVDCDVTPYDESKSHKEGVSWTYKNMPGYSPMNAYGGLEGLWVNTDFRTGSQHSQKGTPEFLVETIDMMHKLTSAKLLFRMDSGNDAAENIGLIIERGEYFIIKRNLRGETKQWWLDFAQEKSVNHTTPREGKDVYIGTHLKDVEYINMEGKKVTKKIRIVYEVTSRTIDKNGQCLLMPDIEVNTFWDNTGLSDEMVIESYHQHATMEQFHSELKSDMDLERLPSGKFETNRLVHELSMIAYNVLRILGNKLAHIDTTPMRGKADRRRLRTVIMNIIRIPARLVHSGRRYKLDIGSSNPWGDTFIELYKQLRAA